MAVDRASTSDRDWDEILSAGVAEAMRTAAQAERYARALDNRLTALENWRNNSGAPLRDTVEIKSPTGWRTRARASVAIAITALVTIAVATWALRGLLD